MKRFLFLLLILLTLTGCGGEAQETQASTEESLAIPTEPPGSYDPDSSVEVLTGGDIRAYPQNIPDIYAIACAGEDLLVFSGMGNTTITRLTGENLYRIAETELNCRIDPDTVGIKITEDRVAYFEQGSHEVVFLDAYFREFRRVKLPAEMLGMPAISEDLQNIVFLLEDGLRVLNVESGISRMLTEMAYPYQMVSGLLIGDTVVQCSIMDGMETWHELYIDTATGTVLKDTDGSVLVSSGGGMYYGISVEDAWETVLFGREGEQAQTLLVQSHAAHIFPREHGVVTENFSEGIWKLDYYDLDSGLRTGSVQLPEAVSGWCFTGDWVNDRIYYYTCGEAESQIIYRWDVEKSPSFDEQIYTGVWYTENAPDLQGLEVCQAKAEAMSQRFGLDIRIWERAVEVCPWDYEMEPEYRIPMIEETLKKLEFALNEFPEGFIPKILESLDGGTLRLCLVRSLTGSAEAGSLDSAEGIQFWVEEDSYLAIVPGDLFLQTFFHELFHAMEMRILSQSIAYYRWDELNPKEFAYDYDYVANQYRDGSAYTQEDATRAFIDIYSMSFPKEDRARIFEYACMEGNESFFISATMQKKLRTLCEGIRDAYGLKKAEEGFLWEQYLESPLAYGR